VAVITNCSIIGFTSHVLRDALHWSALTRFVFIVALEHALLLLKLLAARWVPDVPRWVTKSREYERWQKRQPERAIVRDPAAVRRTIEQTNGDPAGLAAREQADDSSDEEEALEEWWEAEQGAQFL
jgi:hypothetical protein